MAYGSNPHKRIDLLETIVCEQQINCMERGSEAEADHDYELAEQLSRRHEELDLRLERLARISAKLSAGNNVDAISPY